MTAFIVGRVHSAFRCRGARLRPSRLVLTAQRRTRESRRALHRRASHRAPAGRSCRGRSLTIVLRKDSADKSVTLVAKCFELSVGERSAPGNARNRARLTTDASAARCSAALRPCKPLGGVMSVLRECVLPARPGHYRWRHTTLSRDLRGSSRGSRLFPGIQPTRVGLNNPPAGDESLAPGQPSTDCSFR